MLSRHGYKNGPVTICKSQSNGHGIHGRIGALAILEKIENAKDNINCKKSIECLRPAPQPLTEQAARKSSHGNGRIGIHNHFSNVNGLLNAKCCTEFL